MNKERLHNRQKQLQKSHKKPHQLEMYGRTDNRRIATSKQIYGTLSTTWASLVCPPVRPPFHSVNSSEKLYNQTDEQTDTGGDNFKYPMDTQLCNVYSPNSYCRLCECVCEISDLYLNSQFQVSSSQCPVPNASININIHISIRSS